MNDLYLSPTNYGIEDVFVSGGGPARVYFPTDVDYAQPAVLRPGKYDLVVFAHGNRGPGTAGEGLCPEDWSHDYQLWEEVLQLLARCGYVVVVPELSSVRVRLEDSINRLAATVSWMRKDWTHASSLSRSDMPDVLMRATSPEPQAKAAQAGSTTTPSEESTLAKSIVWRGSLVDDDRPVANPTGTALVGHSWGARACAVAIKRGRVAANAFAAVAGTFDDLESPAAITSLGVPTLLMAGDQDTETLSNMLGLWLSTKEPKHQAVIQGIGHWDWFGGYGIQPCDPGAPRPRCIAAWMAASELLLGLLARYLSNVAIPPHLIGPAGTRPPLLHWFDTRKRCSMLVRWVDPSGGGDGSHSVVGQQMFGEWEGPPPPW